MNMVGTREQLTLSRQFTLYKLEDLSNLPLDSKLHIIVSYPCDVLNKTGAMTMALVHSARILCRFYNRQSKLQVRTDYFSCSIA